MCVVNSRFSSISAIANTTSKAQTNKDKYFFPGLWCMSKCNPAWLEKSLPCLIDLLILPTGKKKDTQDFRSPARSDTWSHLRWRPVSLKWQSRQHPSLRCVQAEEQSTALSRRGDQGCLKTRLQLAAVFCQLSWSAERFHQSLSSAKASHCEMLIRASSRASSPSLGTPICLVLCRHSGQRQLHIALHRNDNHNLPEAWHAMSRVIFAWLSRSFSLIKFLYLRSIWQSCPHAHKQRSWLLTSDAWDGSSPCQFACPPKQLKRSFM